MKSSRLLHLLLLLQTRERVTTNEIAQRLEVSRRTVLRDVEALSAAGVPVYTERGRNGGVALLPGSRIDVSRLDPIEAQALLITGLDHDQRRRLGITDSLALAHSKLAAKNGRRGTDGAEGPFPEPLNAVVTIDSSGWFAGASDAVDLTRLLQAIRHRKRIEIRYRRSSESQHRRIIVDPYGVAHTSGRWYLVADVDASPRLFALERMTDFTSMDRPAALREGQTLMSVWRALRQSVEQRGHVTVTARLRSSRLDLARRVLGARLTGPGHPTHPHAEWLEVTVQYEDIESVRQLLQFGDHIEVLTPPEARRRIVELAADLATRHAAADAPDADQ